MPPRERPLAACGKLTVLCFAFHLAELVVKRHMSVPQTFRTSPGSYVALCGVLSAPLAIWGWAALFHGRFDLSLLMFFIALPATAAVWLTYFRLRLDDSGIEYRDLFGRNIRVAYSEVVSLKSHWVRGRYSAQEWLLHLHDGRRLRINLKPFPREVYGLLCERIRCAAVFDESRLKR
jgi:hypothetical protein